ncbi:hypothetical protein Esi_0133_0043 [Ectocarpus siliculosus]|uniref:Uncharacterized protein n=1 Tax=Ectocarpus siliculosus TaxID=2880 RepID=D7FJE3_ECTSI|nr:hypothetical protein Esi_0133_0043 [Ectocarpus siliculosus]|eukprot:CBJ29046.1 hypothetical protein Esi_0133_0043 [Ectocarpus siliculosus]
MATGSLSPSGGSTRQSSEPEAERGHSFDSCGSTPSQRTTSDGSGTDVDIGRCGRSLPQWGESLSNANREAREWRGRRVRAAKMHHWTPVEVASWISHLLRKAETSGKLPLLFSGDAKGGTTSMGGDDTGPGAVENRVINPTEEDAQESGTAANPTPEEGGGVVDSSDTTPVKTEGSSSPAAAPPCDPAPSLADEVKKCSGVLADAQDSSIAGVGQAQGDDNFDKNTDDGGHGDVNNKDDDDDDLSSSAENSNNGWAEVEAGERTGYSGAAVEPFAVKEGINGCCIMEAMEDALGHTEDALTRFIKSSTRLARPAEVEQKRVELMVRELLTIRPYSTASQLKLRALGVVIVRSAEAPRDPTNDEINAQLPSLARVLTAGYRRQAAMVEQGLEFAAARIQGLARGKKIRRVISSIWQQANEYARDIVQGEREARMKREKEQRAKEKEEALEREREEARRYRLRLVPRASSVTCRSMVVSLPLFLVAAARGARSLSLSELRPCTTYRLALAIPPVIRNELLESARSLGVTEAIRSLETPTESETKDNNGGSDGVSGGDGDVGAASTSGHLDVETLPDVPGEVPLLKCKVLTSASAVDPRDPSGVLSLRRWQSPYPAIANMDGPVPEDFVVLAPGRPEPVVSLQWQGPENNGLDICSYTVERRIGRTGAWQKVRSRGGTWRRGDGGGEDGRQPLTFDEVDAPLRTISVDTLRAVAVNGLALSYR